MQRLLLAILASLLLHALLLLPRGRVEGKAVKAQAMTVTMRHLEPAAQAPLSVVVPDERPEDSAPSTEPVATVPPAVEVAVTPSLPSGIAAYGPAQDPQWYRSDEVTTRASPLGVIESSPLALYGGELPPGRAVLEVYVDEFGVTDHVNLLLVSPPGRFDDSVTHPFLSARWSPAVRNGRFVRSVKVVELCAGVCDDPSSIYNGMKRSGEDAK
ncbi:hypothetical protein [Chitinimonas sp.]|uniref:energy transducer TonB n=1 Tax=Chitinimonas sp. TaxID=1934313 RepID=UPI002F931238